MKYKFVISMIKEAFVIIFVKDPGKCRYENGGVFLNQEWGGLMHYIASLQIQKSK